MLNLAAENGYVIVAPNQQMANYVRRMAADEGLNVDVISAHEFTYHQHGLERKEFLVDELEMFLSSLGIKGYSDGQL